MLNDRQQYLDWLIDTGSRTPPTQDPIVISYIWIGSPTLPKSGAPGHDTVGPIKMATALTGKQSYKILFWCLSNQLAYYQTKFKDHPIEVQAIENYITSFLDSARPFIQNHAKKVLAILQESLKEERNTVRDRVNIKNVFSLFLLATQGDYVLDTNIMPSNMTRVDLPRYSDFRLPLVESQFDFWMIFSPPDNNTRAELTLAHYCKQWESLQKIYLEEGYSQYFHDSAATIVRESISAPYCDSVDIGYWNAEPIENNSRALIHCLGIEKNYYNTHNFEMRSEYENKESLLRNYFLQFLLRTSIKNLHASNLNIIISYFLDLQDPLPLAINQLFKRGQQYSELFFAIAKNNPVKLKELIENGGDINQQMTRKDALGETPLHFAVLQNRFDCLRILLAHGANMELKASYPKKMLSSVSPYELAVFQEQHHSNPHIRAIRVMLEVSLVNQRKLATSRESLFAGRPLLAENAPREDKNELKSQLCLK